MADFGKALVPALVGAGTALLVGNLFGKDEPQQPQYIQPPAVEPPAEMPSPDDARMRAAKRKSMAEQRRRQGRASTILTDVDDSKLGG